MKKIISLICALLMLVALIGCSPESEVEVLDYTGPEYDDELTYYSVQNIVIDPEKYVGKTVKYNGVYMVSKNENGEPMNLCVVTYDSCCTTYIEFQLPEGAQYPELNTEITITGNIQTVQHSNTTYPVLLNATIS